MTLENQQFTYDNADNPAYQDEEEDLNETMIEEREKLLREDIDDVVMAFMEYMGHMQKEEVAMDVADALWSLVESGIAFRFWESKKPINIVVNAATRWKAKQLMKS